MSENLSAGIDGTEVKPSEGEKKSQLSRKLEALQKCLEEAVDLNGSRDQLLATAVECLTLADTLPIEGPSEDAGIFCRSNEDTDVLARKLQAGLLRMHCIADRLHQAVEDAARYSTAYAQNCHLSAVNAVHPDFQEVVSRNLDSFLGGLPLEKKSEAEKISRQGSVAEVCALLDSIKAFEREQAATQCHAGI